MDPADKWFEGELSFFDYVVIPIAKKLEECKVFGEYSHVFLECAELNRLEWQCKGQRLVEEVTMQCKIEKSASFPAYCFRNSV